jgi:hypothetical protein
VIQRVTDSRAAQCRPASQCNGTGTPYRSGNHSAGVGRPAVVDTPIDIEQVSNKDRNQEGITKPDDCIGDLVA